MIIDITMAVTYYLIVLFLQLTMKIIKTILSILWKYVSTKTPLYFLFLAAAIVATANWFVYFVPVLDDRLKEKFLKPRKNVPNIHSICLSVRPDQFMALLLT